MKGNNIKGMTALSTWYAPGIINGLRIVEDPNMTIAGKPYRVKRTWRERLFTKPWKPLWRYRTIVPQVPRKEIFMAPGNLAIMHPVIAMKLKEEIGRRNNKGKK